MKGRNNNVVMEHELRNVLKSAFNYTSSQKLVWEQEYLMNPISSVTDGIWRVSVDYWQVVVKIIQYTETGNKRWPSGKDAQHWMYWKREAFMYDKGLFSDWRDGIRPPICYGTFKRQEGKIAIWLEDINVSGYTGMEWDLERFGLAAYQLGCMQGKYINKEQSNIPWLSKDWLKAYLEVRDREGDIFYNPEIETNKKVREIVSNHLLQKAKKLWESRFSLYSISQSYPKTFCHLDLHPKNMFDVSGETVLIDWAFAGAGIIGEDIATLIVDCIADFHMPPTQFDTLFDTLTDCYFEGIKVAGYVGNNNDIKRAVAIIAAVKYSWLLPNVLSAGINTKNINGQPFHIAAPIWAELVSSIVEGLEKNL